MRQSHLCISFTKLLTVACTISRNTFSTSQQSGQMPRVRRLDLVARRSTVAASQEVRVLLAVWAVILPCTRMARYKTLQLSKQRSRITPGVVATGLVAWVHSWVRQVKCRSRMVSSLVGCFSLSLGSYKSQLLQNAVRAYWMDQDKYTWTIVSR